MNDNNQQATNQDLPGAPQQQLPAFMRMQQQLMVAGVDAEATAFILGRMTADIINQVTEEVGRLLTPEEMEQLDQLPDDAQRQARLEQLFAEKKGQSLASYREELSEKLVQEFETQE